MREIKFRVWSEGKLKEWEEINCHPLWWFQNDDNKVLMQYAGLEDKNGGEIYEGDIVQYIDNVPEDIHLYIVSFSNGCFYLESAEDVEYNDAIMNVYPIEIIGNIYENPELLE